MAVEARRLCPFPPQIPGNRGMLNVIEGANNDSNTINNNMMYGEPFGSTTATIAADALIPPASINGKTVVADWTPVKTAMKSDNGLTCCIPILVSRKRPRDSSSAGIANYHRNNLLSFPANLNSSDRFTSVATFLGEDVSLHTQQHQLEIDRLIAYQTAKVRREIEEQRKNYSRRVIRAVEESLTKRLRAKEEEIENIGKLNWALEEKVRSLCAENQIWRELAQSNEATANALRDNLEQVLAGAQQVQAQGHYNAEGLMDDEDEAQSCCGSNYYLDMGEGRGEGAEQVEHKNNTGNNDDIGKRAMKEEESGSGRRRRRVCRNCGVEEASVLLLPCRHLCLCYSCGPALHSCPVCSSTKNATLHINLSSPSV